MSEPTLRTARPSDLEPLVDLETRAMHFPMGHRVREWFRGDHPSSGLDRIAVIEEDGRLLAAAALVPIPLTYRGVPFPAAYWEAVATEASERRRGHCRAIFRYLSDRTDVDLLMVEGLTWLYRRFGYHPAIRTHGGFNAGGRIGRASEFPESGLAVRPAVDSDAEWLASLRAEATRRFVVGCLAPSRAWRHAVREDRSVVGPGGTSLNKWEEVRILMRDGRRVGYFLHDPWDVAFLMELELVPGETTWREAGAAAIRATADFAGQEEVRVALPDSHPLFAVFPRALSRRFPHTSHWAVRIPDPVRLLRRLGPALETRLADSAMAGWTGDLTASRIDDGFRIVVASGRIESIEPWSPERTEEARIRLMPGRFEALFCGYRSLSRNLGEDPDCRAEDEEAEAVIEALFPEGDSFVRAI